MCGLCVCGVGVGCDVWVFVCVGFVMCGCFDSGVSVLVICVLVFTVFCIVCTGLFFVSLMYIYSYLLLV
jgi:hypothetical protein